jgi:hypothetical protein
VYGDSAYADEATLEEQTRRGHDMRTKVPPVRNANGFSKDRFSIDLAAGTVTCPAEHTVAIRASRRHRVARFGALCRSCPLQAQCTKARRGRVISIHLNEAALQHAKARQQDRTWQQDYRTYRPVVERKISHFTRRPWGGRQARCRGQKRILTDILTRAGAVNLARLATLGLHHAAGAGPSPDRATKHPSRGQISDAIRAQHSEHSEAVDTTPPNGHYISGFLELLLPAIVARQFRNLLACESLRQVTGPRDGPDRPR